MDSLGQLGDELPRNNPTLVAAESELQGAFRTSALAITTLFKAAQTASSKAFHAGYSAALGDVQEFLQQGLDLHQGQPSEGIAQIIDYIEARQEALKAESADTDGEELDAHESKRGASRRASAQPSRPPSQQQTLPPRAVPQTQQHQPVASTSQLPQSNQSSARRSVSPNPPRHSTPTVSAGPASAASSPSALSRSFPANASDRPTSAPHVQHAAQYNHRRHASDMSDLPSSSAPPSPYGHRDALRTASSTQPSAPLSSSFDFTHSSSAPLSTAEQHNVSSSPQTTMSQVSEAGIGHSPLTRLQSRRGRERSRDGAGGRQHRSHRPYANHNGTMNSSATSFDESGTALPHHMQHHSHQPSSIGLKRRWTASLLPDIGANTILQPSSPSNIFLDYEDEEEEQDSKDEGTCDTAGEPISGDRQPERRNSAMAEGDEMEMDSNTESYRIDGNARPTKRALRR